MKYLASLFLFVLVLISSCKEEVDYHFRSVNGVKHHVLTWGKGEPVVVFLNGGGSDLQDYMLVQEEISKITKTISYDKPGLGKSELTNVPRTLEHVTKDLRTLLEKENVTTKPIILVGHSMGGFVARYYLHKYPNHVTGMVLIDPGSEYLDAEWKKTRTEVELKEEDSLLREQLKMVSKGFQMEVLAYPQHDSILKTFITETNIPITLLESNKVDNDDELGKILIDIQKRLYRDFQRNLPQTKLISTEVSGHFIQLDEPHLVINAIKEMLDN